MYDLKLALHSLHITRHFKSAFAFILFCLNRLKNPENAVNE